MTQPLLSILIPTVVGREAHLNNLTTKLFGIPIGNDDMIGYIGGMVGEIHLIIAKDNKEMTIGQKRELLYSKAEGMYSIQIDDDDELAPNAIELILDAIKSNPEVDVITFEEYCNMDGKEYKSNHSATYSGWEGDGNSLFPDGFHFHRTPFFKSVIRTDLAKSVPIQKVRFGEDHIFANDLHPLIQSEIHIDKTLYRYIHISSNPTERYGLDKD